MTAVPLPPMRIRMHRDSDERFALMADSLAETLYRFGLQDDHALLDVGCGVGRLAIGLLRGGRFQGRYVGFDVSRKHVRWARQNLMPIAAKYRFRLVDVQNDRYNPDGTVAPEDFRFPVRSANFDFACLFSVFTHFEPEDIRTYLAELERTLRPGGRVVSTWFLWDESRRAKVETGVHPMVFQRDEHTLYAHESDPLWAIAHHVDQVHAWIADAGLTVGQVQHGTWAQGPGPELQDVILLRKPS